MKYTYYELTAEAKDLEKATEKLFEKDWAGYRNNKEFATKRQALRYWEEQKETIDYIKQSAPRKANQFDYEFTFVFIADEDGDCWKFESCKDVGE